MIERNKVSCERFSSVYSRLTADQREKLFYIAQGVVLANDTNDEVRIESPAAAQTESDEGGENAG